MAKILIRGPTRTSVDEAIARNVAMADAARCGLPLSPARSGYKYTQSFRVLIASGRVNRSRSLRAARRYHQEAA